MRVHQNNNNKISQSHRRQHSQWKFLYWTQRSECNSNDTLHITQQNRMPSTRQIILLNFTNTKHKKKNRKQNLPTKTFGLSKKETKKKNSKQNLCKKKDFFFCESEQSLYNGVVYVRDNIECSALRFIFHLN